MGNLGRQEKSKGYAFTFQPLGLCNITPFKKYLYSVKIFCIWHSLFYEKPASGPHADNFFTPVTQSLLMTQLRAKQNQPREVIFYFPRKEHATRPWRGSRELGPMLALATNSVCDIGQFTQGISGPVSFSDSRLGLDDLRSHPVLKS